MDATEHPKAAEKYGIRGYPTLKFFGAASKEPIDYNTGRDEDSFIKFINEHAGTYRVAGGALSALAGRVPSLDEISKKIGADGNPIEPTQSMVRGFMSVPEEFECDINPRSEKHARVIREAFERAEKEGLNF